DRVLPPLETLKFGEKFSKHMLKANWTRKDGWQRPEIVPYGNLSLSPAASSLHYALQCFEGMKAYKTADGEVRLFRPDMNAARMNRSTARLDLPTFDGKEFVECLKELIRVDSDWVPQKHGYSLYIRPTVISTDVCLGVAPAASAMLFMIMSPVGPYWKEGFKPVKLFADNVNVRAWKGGTGAYKLGANYGPTIHPAVDAASHGYQQILWLGPGDSITEVGAMNLFVVFKGDDGTPELVTAPLESGLVLPGVTRDSILALAKETGLKTSVREYTMPELVERLAKGQVLEAFGAGTAAIVCPVDGINYAGKDHSIPCPENSVANSMMEKLQAIQYGEVQHPWSVAV
ncbi:hypothetical protein DIPPA_00128, partial [Diplonema papillatum]